MSVLDAATLEKIAAEVNSMPPGERELIRQAIPQLANFSTDVRHEWSSSCAPNQSGLEIQPEKSDPATLGASIICEREDTPLPGEGQNLVKCLESISAESQIAHDAAALNESPPRAAARSSRPGHRYWALTAGLCLCFTIGVFAATHSWHTRLEAERWSRAAAAFRAPEPPPTNDYAVNQPGPLTAPITDNPPSESNTELPAFPQAIALRLASLQPPASAAATSQKAQLSRKKYTTRSKARRGYRSRARRYRAPRRGRIVMRQAVRRPTYRAPRTVFR